ncbi:MAG: ECF-type sigma factor [Phycisphaerales bacterium JB043]
MGERDSQSDALSVTANGHASIKKIQPLDRAFEQAYDELHDLAVRRFTRERRGHTLQATALIGELFLRLRGQRDVNWDNKTEFFCICARTMRRILVDHARQRGRLKRGGEHRGQRIELSGISDTDHMIDIIDLDDAIQSLERLDAELGQIAELRIFGELTHEQIAARLGISPRTARRHWSIAKARLRAEFTANAD